MRDARCADPRAAVLDGAGEPVPDALVEVWQAAPGGCVRVRRATPATAAGSSLLDGQAGRPAGAAAGAAPRGRRVRARAPQARRDADVLPGRGRGERGRSGAVRGRRGTAARRSSRCREPDGSLRFDIRLQGDGRDRVLRAVTFDAIFVPEELREAVSDRAWVEAMLEAERALANAEALAGVVPGASRRADRRGVPDRELRRRGDRRGGAVSRATRPSRSSARCGRSSAARRPTFVHFGATSQDIVDSAAMLVARRALGLIGGELDGVAAACAGLARGAPVDPDGRADAAPAGGADDLRLQGGRMARGGRRGAGRLASAARPVLPPSSAGRRARSRRSVPTGSQVRRLLRGRARARGAGAALAHGPRAHRRARLGARDRRGRVREDRARRRAARADRGRARSASRPGRAAPRRCRTSETRSARRSRSRARGACRRAAGGARAGLVLEHERALGAWQAEWGALSDALAYAGGAAAAMRRRARGLEVDAARMRANLDASGGGVMSERVTFVLARRIGLSTRRTAVAGARGVRRSSARRAGGRADPGGARRGVRPGRRTSAPRDEFVDAALAYYRGGGG